MRSRHPKACAGMIVAVILGSTVITRAGETEKVFRVGASAVDVSPQHFPVIVNGGFLQAQTSDVKDKLHARAIVLDDGASRLAIVVVDSCMMPRELIDRAKQRAHEKTGISVDRMLVSATHTHSAPACMGALGTSPDDDYVARLPGWIAESIARANERLAPAHVGWTVVKDDAHTHCRRWIRRPDRLLADPFGDRTVRANMHPGYESPDVIGPSGPVDPALSILLFRTPEGRPIALLANYSMHYFGTAPVSADYFGRFAALVADRLKSQEDSAPCVAIMSQGTSGDQHWMDYGRPKDNITIEAYAEAMAREVADATRTIMFQRWVPLAMAESRVTLRRRVPDEKRLAWARPIVAAMGERIPKTLPEVYAREAVRLHDEPERELKLQAIRVGDLGIAAIPNEVYALTGLKIKAQSPLSTTFVMELANGSEGYIPPPEQHRLGGYTTWPARTAALEVEAEPKIADAVLALLERVAERPRRAITEPNGPYVQAVLASKPLAYWRLSEMSGRDALDSTGHRRAAAFNGGFALYLEGPPSDGFSGPGAINRAAHLAGGHLAIESLMLGRSWSAELWFWNGLANDARPITGVLLSGASLRQQLVLAGNPARLALVTGDTAERTSSMTDVPRRTWHHVVLTRDGDSLTVYLNGERALSGRVLPGEDASNALIIGGARNRQESLEGRIDEVAVYDRVLGPDEIERHRHAVEPPTAR